MKVPKDLARFIHTFGDGLFLSRRPLTFLFVVIICFIGFPQSNWAGNLDGFRGEAVLHTDDGQIIAGWVKSSSEGQLNFETKFGELLIQWDDVVRVNGEQYSQDEGIVREHQIELRADGSAKVNSLVPVSLKSGNETTTFLALGRVMQVLDLDERPLAFSTSMLGDFSRCVVKALPYRVPAMKVTTIEPEAASVTNGILHYEFEYTPRMNQTFKLEVGIPVAAKIMAATPAPSNATETELQWQLETMSQRNIRFGVDLKLAE